MARRRLVAVPSAEEIRDRALRREFEVQPLIPFCKVQSEVELSAAVKAHAGIMSLCSGTKEFRLPNPTQAAFEADRLAWRLEEFQHLIDPSKRDLVVESLSKRLHSALCAFNESYRPNLIYISALGELKQRLGIQERDQVVRVSGFESLQGLQEALSEVGQCLPIGQWPVRGKLAAWRISSLIGLNLPHTLEARFGSWSDWILGARVVLADGTIASCGSGVVKNVSGYDFHKLLVGARETLGVVVEVTLRTTPLSSLPKAQLEGVGRTNRENSAHYWVHRVRRSDFKSALEDSGERLLAQDHESSTLWTQGESPIRHEGDWLLGHGQGIRNIEKPVGAQATYAHRVKELFDPTNKLNPGELP